MTTVPEETFRKSTFSGQDSDCVELSNCGRVRDSKNAGGPVLTADLGALLAALKTDLIR